MEPMDDYHLRPDKESGRMLVMKGRLGPGDEDYEAIGPVIQDVQQYALPAWYGLPQYWADAAANADDSYFDMGTAVKDCTSASLYVETNDAIVSFDGGTTDHFFVDVDAGQIVITGLNIPKGSVISGKNAVATADYTNLRVSIW